VTIVCYHCGAPREIESQTPGVTKYKKCAQCGGIGIRDLDDRYQVQKTRPKKPFKQLYERRSA